jgi:type IV pilus assembly protein PilP
MMRPRHIFFVALAGFSAGCSGGGDDAAPDAGQKATAKTLEQKAADTQAELQGPAPFTYSPVGKRDPFRSYLADLAEQSLEHSPQRKREETEEYELDQYRLTGIITGTAQPKAMVEDPGGRGHVLHIGSRMGKNGGRIARISSGGIVVVEETRDPTGKKVRLPITIKLPKAEFEDIVQR